MLSLIEVLYMVRVKTDPFGILVGNICVLEIESGN